MLDRPAIRARKLDRSVIAILDRLARPEQKLRQPVGILTDRPDLRAHLEDRLFRAIAGPAHDLVFKAISALLNRLIPGRRKVHIIVAPVVSTPAGKAGILCRFGNAPAVAESVEKLRARLWGAI